MAFRAAAGVTEREKYVQQQHYPTLPYPISISTLAPVTSDYARPAQLAVDPCEM